MVDEDQKEDRKKVLVEYFVEDRGVHDMYALKFFFCEFLNLINVIGQLFFMDFFLGGEFSHGQLLHSINSVLNAINWPFDIQDSEILFSQKL